MSNDNDRNLQESQENQKRIGTAEKDPETTYPSGNLGKEPLKEPDRQNPDKEYCLIFFFWIT